jgi:threonine aldolase
MTRLLHDPVDLRSDTVTRPTADMYDAMQRAPLGDDVLGDDPTVMRLEEIAAEAMGKEEAVFVPSGTMGNQIALAAHCRPGDAILIEEEAHILYYEVGGPALIAGVVSWTLPSKLGVMDPEAVRARILKQNLHTPGTRLICLENTHNRAGGTVVPLDKLQAYRRIADEAGVAIHLDGARVFNAAVALGVPVWEIAKSVDSVNFCLSKGLRAPIGSVLCGERAMIEEARIWRKRLGGGMRQAGVLAACGIVSLKHYVDRLAEDHDRARRMAEALSELKGIHVDWDTVQTNMVLATTDRPAVEWQELLRERGVLCFPVAPNRLRLVFHADIDDQKLNRAMEAFEKVAGLAASVA